MVKRSAGLVLITDIPGMGIVAVLQVRGKFNPETMEPKSWPGGCQVTCHEKCGEKEYFASTIKRVVEEKLGIKYAKLIKATQMEGKWPPSPEFVQELKTKLKHSLTYALAVKPEILREFRLNASSGGFRLLREKDVKTVVSLFKYPRKRGVQDGKTIAMFPDELEAVKVAFKKCRPLPEPSHEDGSLP